MTLELTDPTVDLATWEDRGREIVATVSQAAWDLGDWVNEARGEWGDTYKRAFEITGVPVKTLQKYGYVAARFPLRRGKLTFHHHELVAWIPEEAAAQWLDLAEAEKWSTRDLQTALRSVRQLPPGRPEVVASIFRITVPTDHEELWRAAASQRGLEIEEWLIQVADEAASG